MRRLFWYITLSFLAVSVIITLALSGFASKWHEEQTIPGLNVTRMQLTLDGYLANAKSELAHKGPEGLSQWLDIIGNELLITVYAVDGDGRPLSKHKIPDDTTAALAAAGKNLANTPKWLRATTATYGNQTYTIVCRFEPSFMKRLENAPMFRALGKIMLVTVAVGALLLAWYITSPLAQIQRSAHRYAQGDLDARVGRLKFGRATEIVALAAEFDRMSERIKSLVDSYKSLIRDVSHELRSPLARLRVALELARTPDPPATDITLERIESEANRLENMLRQTIELAKLQMATPLKYEPVSLNLLLDEIVANADYEGAARDRRVVLTETETILTRGNHEAIYSALENVIRNALRYTDSGTTVDVSLKRSGPHRAIIRVRDHGPGLSEQEIARVFEPFYRTNSARAQCEEGTGLGLAIVRSAVQRHKGEISVRTLKEGGLEITISLPIGKERRVSPQKTPPLVERRQPR